jgi:hypothetical protein
MAYLPGVETPGYFQASLRDARSIIVGVRAALRRKPKPTYFFVHRSTQSFTVLYQSCEFCGFCTQWPSSGK